MKNEQSIDLTIEKIRKRFGEDILIRLDDDVQPVEVISTGCLSLDLALGVGGVPRGRITEIYGPDASGKTTVCLHIIAEAQKAGGWCGFIDMEHALDLAYAQQIGINIFKLCISQPDTGEIALELLEEMVRSKKFAVVVIDSVAALVPQAEIEGSMGDSPMGMQARLMSQALRKLSGAIKTSNTAVIFTNQLRQKIGVVFGNPEVTSGGVALKYYASVRMDIRRRGQIKQGTDILGNHARVRIVKNKVAPPFRIAEFGIIYGQGISIVGDVVQLGTQLDVLHKTGNWYYYGDERLGNGLQNTVAYLQEHTVTLKMIQNDILQRDEVKSVIDFSDAQDDDDQS